MEPVKPTNKKVHVKLDEDNARILFEIVHKAVRDIYAGDDWNDRSTLDERTDRLMVEAEVRDALYRFDKRMNRI